ncbi:MAG TPA: YIP1 family protein [Candidatus Dormibacteraeota bacterium]|nr:YIP1 family protein [Candidatus Dormibacteraeota bacterium]
MFSDLVSLIRRPLGALTAIDRERPASYGVIGLVLSVVMPAATAELAAFGPFRPPADLGSLPTLTAQGADIYARWSYAHRFLLPLYGIAISLALWLLAAAFIHAIAHALRGKGDFVGFLKLAGYIALLGLVALPIQLLDALARLMGNAGLEDRTGQLAGLLAVGIFVWQNFLLVYAARQHYGLSTERAVAAVIGPIGGVAVLGLALVIITAVLFVLSQTS